MKFTRHDPIPTAILTLAAAAAIFVSACARAPISKKEDAMRQASSQPELSDDLDLEPFIHALEKNIIYLERTLSDSSVFHFGKVKIPKAQYLSSLRELVQAGKSGAKGEFLKTVSDRFDFFEVYGKKEWGEAYITSYFEPLLQGSSRPSQKFSRPIYRLPDDLVMIQLDRYFEAFPRLRERFNASDEFLARDTKISGRWERNSLGQPSRIIPYYSREEIDSGAALQGRKLEICWLDPIDAFFLQIQGSGTILLENGKQIRVGFAGKNGHPYRAIGKELTHVIPLEKMSYKSIVNHLRTLSSTDLQVLLNKNPSYTFFSASPNGPITTLGTGVIPGRTIATDPTYFPKGTLAFLSFKLPKLLSNGEVSKDLSEWASVSRFVLDQDTGGAIRGPDRLDLFWGQGSDAGEMAGHMKQWGKLYYLVPKIRTE